MDTFWFSRQGFYSPGVLELTVDQGSLELQRSTCLFWVLGLKAYVTAIWQWMPFLCKLHLTRKLPIRPFYFL